MMVVLGPTLETDRLLLRPPCAEDFGAWAAFMADPVAARFLGGPQPPGTAWRSLAAMTGAWVISGFANFSVIEKASGRWIGRAGPWYPHGWPGPEVGWAFDRSAWGKGYATEAGLASIAFGFADAGLEEIVSFTSAANVRSRAVMDRIGMTHDPADDFDHPELHETDPLRPHVLYRMSAADLAR